MRDGHASPASTSDRRRQQLRIVTSQAGEGPSVCPTSAETQQVVNSHFERTSAYWREVYEGQDVIPLICQRRRDIALRWIDELELPVGGRLLEVGCGAGLTAAELARRGFDVDATDTVPDMIELARRHAEQANVSERLRTSISDVHALDFDDKTFDAVVALGVLPWLHSPQVAIHELARVLKPGAHLVVSANNIARLSFLIDPRHNRALSPARKAVKRLLGRLGVRRWLPSTINATPNVAAQSRGEVGTLLSAANLEMVTELTVGFGPFTLFDHRFLPVRLGRRVHEWLQMCADAGVPWIRWRGGQYLVLARKTADG